MISRLITPHLLFLGLWMTAAAEIRIDDVQRLLRTGEYEKCLKQVESARGGPDWSGVGSCPCPCSIGARSSKACNGDLRW